jgi:hypothetical protein
MMNAHQPLVILAVIASLAAASAAEARPAPATQPMDVVKGLVDALASPDPQLRRAARRELLQLDPANLPVLQKLVHAGAASLPAQREALREVVMHLYLMADPLPPAMPIRSFMGVELRPPPPDGPEMIFRDRLIGFPAYAALEPGDILLYIEEDRRINLSSPEQLALFRESTPPGTVIHFRVLREGQLLSVPMVLAVTPNWSADGRIDVEAVKAERLEAAQRYWETHFAVAFDAGTS